MNDVPVTLAEIRTPLFPVPERKSPFAKEVPPSIYSKNTTGNASTDDPVYPHSA